MPIDSALRTTDLNQYLSSDYGGKVYKTVNNTYVDLDHYRVLRNAPSLSEGLARVDDDDKLIEVDTRLDNTPTHHFNRRLISNLLAVTVYFMQEPLWTGEVRLKPSLHHPLWRVN